VEQEIAQVKGVPFSHRGAVPFSGNSSCGLRSFFVLLFIDFVDRIAMFVYLIC